MEGSSILSRVLLEFRRSVDAFAARLRSKESITAFMRDLGWDLPSDKAPSFEDFLRDVSEIKPLVFALENATSEPERLAALASLTSQVIEVLVRIESIGDDFASISFGGAPPLSLDDLKRLLPIQLRDYVIVEYLRDSHRAIYVFLRSIGVIEERRIEENGDPQHRRLSYTERALNARRLASFLVDPRKHFSELFAWGGDRFDDVRLNEIIQSALGEIGVPAGLYPPHPRVAAKLLRIPEPTPAQMGRELRVTVLELVDPDAGYLDAALSVYPLPSIDGLLPGLALIPSIAGELGESLRLGPDLELRLVGEVTGGIAIEMRPGTVRAYMGVVDEESALTGEIRAEFVSARPSEPLAVFEGPGRCVLQFGATSHVLSALADSSGSIDASWALKLDGGYLRIDAGEGDGFLQHTLPGSIESTFDLSVGWSSERGVFFGGSGALEITLPVHRAIGLIRIAEVFLQVGIGDDGGFVSTVALSADVALGPVSASVTRIGVRIPISIPDGSGNAGPFQVDSPRFKPPTGAGLSVDTGAVVGAGFLEFDQANQQYAGALALKAGTLGLTAIGLITTKMPDGSKGFSLLISICATFNPPIQLAFGFSLAGVGGLIGVHRTMDVEALRVGVKNRTLDSILFPNPETIIPNAAKIISDMQAVFPAREGRVVVGPIVKIGFGSPAIITADIGIFIELPEPVRVVLLGQLEAILPDKTSSVVVIHLDVVGVLDATKCELTFQATLYDSRVLNYPIYGDSAFLLGWGDDPRFALSLGGFHPSFTPPAPPTVFANLGRLTIALSSGSDLQLTCAGYLALTPNTLQFGARVDLYASASGARIRGLLAFDTLIHFSPFSFEVAMAASVRISYKGQDLAAVDLTMLLSGPTPWLARGKAKIDVLFISVTVKFSIQWGQEQKASLPAVDPLQDVGMGVLAVMRMPSSWSAALPAGKSVVEALSPEQSADNLNDIVVHPLGRLEVRQKVPLGINLAKAGNAPVIGHDWIDITHATINGAEAECVPVEDAIGRGQWEDLGDRALSVPSFEKLKTGVAASLKSIKVCGTEADPRSAPPSASMEYESVLINADKTASEPKQAPANWSDVEHIVRARAERQEALAAGPQRRFAVPRGRAQLKVKEEGFGIASAGNMTRSGAESRSATPSRRMTRFEADQLLQSARGQAGDDAADRLVVPECEVAK